MPHDPANIITTCEGLRLMRENLSALSELRAQQERLMAEALQLQQDMIDFCSCVRDQVDATLVRTPLDLRPRRAAANLDDEPSASDAERLPPPLQPQVVVPPLMMTGSSMTRSLSNLFSNGTKTISCTNAADSTPTYSPPAASFLPNVGKSSEIVEPGAATGRVADDHQAVGGVSEINSASTPAHPSHDRTFSENVSPLVAADIDKVGSSESQPNGEEKSGLVAASNPDDNSAADDTASVSSLLLDSTMTSLNETELSLLDDPFIALGANQDRDSPLDESETFPRTPDDSTNPGFVDGEALDVDNGAGLVKDGVP